MRNDGIIHVHKKEQGRTETIQDNIQRFDSFHFGKFSNKANVQ